MGLGGVGVGNTLDDLQAPAVCILSGGLDSTTCMAVAHDEGYDPLVAVSFSYGQRHTREINSAKLVADHYHARHFVLPVALNTWGGSALTDLNLDVPTDRGLKEMAMEIPITYVPGRNLVFLALAASLAEAQGSCTVFFGATQVDYSGYPDCRREFLTSLTHTLNVGTKIGVQSKFSWKIKTPLLMLGKKDIIKLGLELGAPYQYTWSCYKGGSMPCGQCDSCKLRAAGFAELGVEDPALAYWNARRASVSSGGKYSE